jgi:hypothetical protein
MGDLFRVLLVGFDITRLGLVDSCGTESWDVWGNGAVSLIFEVELSSTV